MQVALHGVSVTMPGQQRQADDRRRAIRRTWRLGAASDTSRRANPGTRQRDTCAAAAALPMLHAASPALFSGRVESLFVGAGRTWVMARQRLA